MNQDDELSMDFVESLLAQPQSRGRRHKSESEELEERNVNTWFKYAKGIHGSESELRSCEVPGHNEERPRNKGMTVVIKDVAVCRVCFLAGLDRE